MNDAVATVLVDPPAPSAAAGRDGCCAWCGLPAGGARTPVTRTQTCEPLAGSVDSLYCCYGCRIAHAITEEGGAEGAIRWTVVRLGLSIFFTMNLMAFTMTMWSLDVYDVQSTPFQLKLFEVFRWLSMLLALPVLLLLGLPLLQNAVESWKHRIYSTDVLIATGVMAAYLISVINVVQGRTTIYFEVGAMVLVAVTLGRWLEAVGRQKATEALDKLTALLPQQVRRLEAGGEQMVAAEQIRPGDQLRIRAGERFATDGILRSGRTTVDEQVFTGESIPLERVPGAAVLAGTVNLDGDVVVEATAEYRGGSFGRLLNLLQVARLARGRYQQLADRIAGWFLPLVTVISVLTLVLHASSGMGAAIQHSLSVLLIACPCALGLATPLAVWTSLSIALRNQVLFRSGEAMERLATVVAVCIDKTGTLTTGTPFVSRLLFRTDSDEGLIPAEPRFAEPLSVQLVYGEHVSRDWLMAAVAELADASRHPFSLAVAEYCRQEDRVAADRTGRAAVCARESLLRAVRTVAGGGVEGVGADGRFVRLGSPEFVAGPDSNAPATDGITCVDSSESVAFLNVFSEHADRDGQSLVAVSIDGTIMAALLLCESIRPEAVSALESLRRLGVNATVLTGDRIARAERLQQELPDSLNIRVQGQLKPEDKVRVVEQIRRQSGPVAMVGDGINDAPALAASDVGIAMGCGADVSRDSAQICLLGNDLSRIPWAIRLSRRTCRVIRQNLFWAFAYNSAGVIIAALGWLNPAVAAGLMIVSSLLVITNSLRLMSFDSAQGVPDHGVARESPRQPAGVVS